MNRKVHKCNELNESLDLSHISLRDRKKEAIIPADIQVREKFFERG